MGTAKWMVEDGVIVGGQFGDPKKSGLLTTNDSFTDFELSLDFMIVCTAGFFIIMILTSCSVVVLVVDQLDVGLVKSERDPPVAADPDRPVAGKVTLERVYSKRRDRKVVRALRHVEKREDAQQLRDVRRLDTLL